MARFDPRRNVFHRDGSLDDFHHLAFMDDLASALGRSREAREPGADVQSILCDGFVHALHVHARRSLATLDPEGFREVMLVTFPRYVEIEATAAGEIVSTLDALFRFLDRAHRLPHARGCLAVLREPAFVAALEQAIDDPALDAFTPTMCMMSLSAGLDDQDLGEDPGDGYGDDLGDDEPDRPGSASS